MFNFDFNMGNTFKGMSISPLNARMFLVAIRQSWDGVPASYYLSMISSATISDYITSYSS